MKKTILAGLATGLFVFGVAVHANADLVVNGGFETGDFTGWTQGGDTSFTSVADLANTLSPHSGTYFAALGPFGEGDGTLSQAITTVSGHNYKVSFFLANDGDAPNNFSATFGTSTLLSLTDISAFGYAGHVFTFNEIATGNETLQFNFQNAPGFFGLDDVSVIDLGPGNNTVPEPTSMLLFGMGFAGLAGLRFRRKR